MPILDLRTEANGRPRFSKKLIDPAGSSRVPLVPDEWKKTDLREVISVLSEEASNLRVAVGEAIALLAGTPDVSGAREVLRVAVEE